MIYQTDPLLPRPVQKAGCYFLSILYMLNERWSIPMTVIRVTELWYRELEDGDADIDNEAFVGNPQDLVDDIVGAGRVRFLGKYPSAYLPKDSEREILCWHKKGNGFDHFAYGNGKGIVIYDPWSAEGSDSVRNGELVGKRIYRIL